MQELREKLIRNRITDNELQTYYDNNIENVYNRTDYDIFKDLEMLKDIDKGSELLLNAIDNNKTIVISCDFDADGIPGCKVLMYIITKLLNYKRNVIPVIGGRRFGRGLCNNVVDKIKKIKTVMNTDVDLLITIDHGTTDIKAYEELKTYYPNLKIILTDHHTVEYDIYPTNVDAFINPQRKDSTFSKNICGNMVSFLLGVYTYYKKTGIKDLKVFNTIIPYVTISTISDIMSMKDPLNRYIVKYGIDVINKSETLDNRLKYIFKKLDLKSYITPQDISMSVSPLINTGNRLSSETTMLAALLLDDSNRYQTYINKMIELNKFRKLEVSMVLTQILSSTIINIDDYGMVLVINNTRSMLAGIIAGNIAGMYNRPTICFTDTNNDMLTGSARSGIENLDMLSIIREIQKNEPTLEITANGHASSFGVSIKREKIEEFKIIFNNYCKNVIDRLEIKDITNEFEIDSKDLTISLARMIVNTGPYGLDFSNPIFLIRNVTITEITQIRTFFKLKIVIEENTQPLTGMFFFKSRTKLKLTFSNFTTILKKNIKVNILANISTSTFRNMSFVSLDILDIVPVDI